MNRLLKHAGNRFVPVALTLFCGVLFIQTYASLVQTAYANGWDGYYYLVQVRSWFTDGQMHSEDHTLIYPLMIAVQTLTDDYILTYKVASSLARTLFVVSVAVYGAVLCGAVSAHNDDTVQYSFFQNWAPVLCIASWAAAAPVSFYFISQYPKNMLGFSFFFFFCAVLEYIRSARGKDKTPLISATAPLYIILFLLFAAAFVTHRFSGALSLVALCVYVFMYMLQHHRHVVLYGLAAAAAVFSLSLLLPGTLHLYDLERFSGSLAPEARILPLVFMENVGVGKFPLYWKAGMYASYAGMGAFTLFTLYRLLSSRLTDAKGWKLAPLALLFLLGVFPFYTFSLTGIGSRFFLGAQIAAPLLIAGIPDLIRRLPQWTVTVFSLLLVLSSVFTYRAYDPALFDPPYNYYAAIVDRAVRLIDKMDEKPSLVVAHKSLAEFMTFESGIDVLPWAPEERYSRETVWRIVYGLSGDAVDGYGSVGMRKRMYFLKGRYTLIREDDWHSLAGRLSREAPETFDGLDTWLNPMRVRPAYLMRGRKK
ncbi:MAG: hypothetical protein ACOCWH_04695 [Spirochaetota bacterium]